MEVFKKSLPNIIGGLAVVLILSVAGWMWSHYKSADKNVTEIIAPREGASVPHMAQLSGVYSESYKNHELWIVVQPVQSPAYHPQTSKIPKQSNNKWKAVAYVGRSAKHNIGEEFIIHLVSATTSASSNFNAYLIESAKRKSWVGLDLLPNGATVIDSVSVIRK